MTELNIKESLDEIIKGVSRLNPDNHDQVNAVIAVSNIESAQKIKASLDDLRGQISGLTYALGTIMEQQTNNPDGKDDSTAN